LKRKLFLAAILILVLAALAGGATMAWFTSAASNAPNTFTAGTVSIAADRGLGEPLPGPMFYTTLAEGQVGPLPAFNPTGPWFPGMAVTRNLEVRNIGTLQVRLHQVSAAIYSINGLPPDLNPALAAAFAANMNVKVRMAANPLQVLYNGSLAALLTGPQACIFEPVIAPWIPPAWPPMQQLAFEVTMSTAAGNILQGVVPVVEFFVHAEQTANNP
jgi:predicted ribosomally synthesized peptide with SipW-like signal peptide